MLLQLLTFSRKIGVSKLSARPRALIHLVTWDTNAGPLSLSKDPGTQTGVAGVALFLLVMPLATWAAVSLLAGYTFLSHPDNVSASTKRCLKLPGILGMTLKSASLSQNMFLWSEWALSGDLLMWGLVLGCLCADGAGLNSPDWLYVSFQKLPWSQLTSFKGLCFPTEFQDESPWWLDKLQLGERSTAHFH